MRLCPDLVALTFETSIHTSIQHLTARTRAPCCIYTVHVTSASTCNTRGEAPHSTYVQQAGVRGVGAEPIAQLDDQIRVWDASA